MVIVILNAIFMFIFKYRRAKKFENAMHSLFRLEQIETAPWISIGFVGALDMGFAFCLFWPANLIPAPVVLIFMQL